MFYFTYFLHFSLANTVKILVSAACAYFSREVDSVFVPSILSFFVVVVVIVVVVVGSQIVRSSSENIELHRLFHGDGTIILKFKHEFAYFIPYVWPDCLSFFQKKSHTQN